MKWFSWLCCLLLSSTIAPSVCTAEPAAKVPAGLRQTVTLDFENLTLEQCADRLRTLTKLNVIVHESLRPLLEAREQRLALTEPVAPMPPPGREPADPTRQVQQPRGFSCSLRQLPLAAALSIFLDHYGLGYAVVDDSLVIATAAKAKQLQREQPATLAFDNVPLQQVIEDLSQRYGITLVLDRHAGKDAKAPITLQARDLALEEAVHLLAETVNLKAAPLGKGWLLTTAEKAKEWQARAQRRAEDKSGTVIMAPGLLGSGVALPGTMGLDLGGLGGGLGGPGLGGGGAVETLEVPRALLQLAGPPPRIGQVTDKVAPAVPLGKNAEPRKSLAAETLKKLQEPFDFTDDNPVTLKDALKVMQDMGGPPVIVHTQAFKMEAPDAPDVYDAQVKFPPIKGLPRAKVLQHLLEQSSDFANFLVRPGYVLVTTNDAMQPQRQFIRGAGFVQKPLDEALVELSELSGISIVLDPRVGDKSKTLIMPWFPGETNVAQATRVLADMADLKAVAVDAILYVTVRSNATTFPEEPLGNGRYMKRDAAQ